ncbi:MAG: hypothetical protein VW262_05115 [Flavobacteriaceae bacterium]
MREVILFFRPLPILLGVLFFSLISCGKKPLERNPFLPEVRFQREIDLSLPLFNGLSFVGGSILLNDIGFNGVILFNLNGSTFLAWEATCPNHVPKSCSKLSLSGVLSECSCEGFQYSLATGIIINPSETLSPPQNLLYYQVEEYNGILRISN